MRFCVIDKNTNACINVVELEVAEEFIPYSNEVELAQDHSGEIGWVWENETWKNPNKVEITEELLARRMRNKRDLLLKKNVDKINAVRWNAFTEAQKQEWDSYRSSLLDIPQQPGFPHTVTWPEVPQR